MVSKMLSNGAKTRPIWFYGVDTQKASLVRILMKVTKQFCQFPFSVFFRGEITVAVECRRFRFYFRWSGFTVSFALSSLTTTYHWTHNVVVERDAIIWKWAIELQFLTHFSYASDRQQQFLINKCLKAKTINSGSIFLQLLWPIVVQSTGLYGSFTFHQMSPNKKRCLIHP